ncbi:MAG: 50S ribosomal protein L18 [Candidatus Lokiarchaeota archaeon]|nr:50S ribosomal protein L18 [Candidatus Lokiarchaeota archaeon]
MANGPNYRVPFRRRREGKTNYYARKSLLISGRSRVVIRPSGKNVVAQVTDAKLKGDRIRAAASSKMLQKEFKWEFGTGNLPSAYLTGYLLGKKALKAGITNGIADIGLRTHINRTWAVLKGVIDAGMEVPADEEVFPDEDRLTGKHIESYAKQVKESTKKGGEDGDVGSASQFQFSKVKDSTKISAAVAETKKQIDKKYS